MPTMGRLLSVLCLAVTVGCGGASETNRNLVKQRVEAGLAAESERLEAVGRLHRELSELLATLQAQAVGQQRAVAGADEVTEQLATLAKEIEALRQRLPPRTKALEVFGGKMPQKKLTDLDAQMTAEHTTGQAAVEALFPRLEAVRASINGLSAAGGAQATAVDENAGQEARQRMEAAREAEAAPRREALKHLPPHTD